MDLPDSFIQELLSKNDIESVASSYVAFKRRGRNLVGLCPFHGEKTASFSVAPDKGIYYCFGCHKGGGAINFVMELCITFSFRPVFKNRDIRFFIFFAGVYSSRRFRFIINRNRFIRNIIASRKAKSKQNGNKKQKRFFQSDHPFSFCLKVSGFL